MEKNKKIIIGVISHKEYKMPKQKIYLPIEVSAYKHNTHFYDFRDDFGDNITLKNDSFCELTGIYAAYKNLKYDYLGFVHYRRLFLKKGFFVKKSYFNLLDESEIINDLNKYDFILPKKRHYYIESNYEHYVKAHKAEALNKTIEIIKLKYPEYYPYIIKQMKKKSCHLFNMFIASADNTKKYLDWLFSVLFELEKSIDINEYVGYDKRVFGFIAERLIDVYIEKNNLSYCEKRYMFTEKQNWPKKIFNFIKRHFLRKHDTSKQ